jgi:hypothetical protein
MISISKDEYVEKSDLQNHDNEEINSWDILVDRAVYIFPIALVITKSFYLIFLVSRIYFIIP